MNTPSVEVEYIGNEHAFALYVNGYYQGAYPKAILNIKLMAWHLPELL